jgi:3D (Asp-Asp-Asp) domain-containing protein
MQATAYTYTGYRTATGQNPAVGMVAVDPSVIPLGSRMYIEGYGYARAADTGGAVRGDKIDLFMEEYGQCIHWGRRMVKVYLLE